MKTFKILFAAIVIAGFATSAMADTPGNQQTQTAEATAVVLAELTLAKTSDINWGQVARGDNPNLDPTDGEATNGAGLNGTTTSIGKFVLTGEGGASINVAWEKEDLEGPTGSDNIVFSPVVSFGELDGDNGGDEIGEGAQNIHTSGTNYFWVGGSIAVDAEQAAGSYAGSFTLIVEYN